MGKKNSLFLAAALALAATIGMSASDVTPAEKLCADGTGTSAKLRLSPDVADPAARIIKAKPLRRATENSIRRAVSYAPAAASNLVITERDDVPEFYGAVVYADHWDNFDNLDGLYKVPGNSRQSFEFLIQGVYAVNGGFLKDNIYYGARTSMHEYLQVPFTYFSAYDITNGEWLMEKPALVSIVSMTYDPVSENAYVIGSDNNGSYLGILTYGEYEAQISYVGSLKGDWNSLATGKDGQLYGIRVYYEKQGEEYVATRSELYKIDKQTAAQTLVGETGFKPQYPSDSAIDPLSGKMYWTVSQRDDIGLLTEVDITTGKATAIFHYPHNEEICGLTIRSAAAYDKAPGAVSDLQALFTGGSLSGKVNFTAPTRLFDGSMPTDNLTYTILANGQKVAGGFTRFGEKLSVDVTMETAGLYDFMVYVSNGTGDSPKSRIDDVFVGRDTPCPTVATLSYTNGNMELSWQPVTTAVNNGYIDADAVRYDVRRYPDDVAVATGIKATEFSEPIAEPATVVDYYYTVTSVWDGKESAPARSNTVRLGSLKPPYTYEFSNGQGSFVVVDANSDGMSWFWDDMHRSMRLNTYQTISEQCDDWLLSPAINLKAGNAYKIYMTVATSSAMETIEVKMGRGTDVSDLNISLIEPFEFQAQESTPRELVATVTPAVDGDYTVGIHGMSPSNRWHIYVQRFEISPAFSANVPQPVSDLKAVPSSGGVLEATISFKAPQNSINGNPLATLEKIEILRGDEVVKTFSNPAPGSALSHIDRVEKEGRYDYSVKAYSVEGAGDPVSAWAYIGTGKAVAPARLDFTHNMGQVTLSWDASVTNEYGTAINAADVKYNIYTVPGYAKREILAEGVNSTTYTYQAVEAGQQKFMQYAVYPVTTAGEGKGTVSSLQPVGTPYNGLHESGSLDCVWNASGSGASWTIVEGNTEDVPLPAQDGDNLMLAMSGYNVDDYALLGSGMITVDGMTRPTLTFYTFPLGSGDRNELSVLATDLATGEQTELTNFVLNTLPSPDSWNRVMVSLDKFVGKTFTLTFKGILKTHEYTLVDNITVGNIPGADLAAIAINAPARAYTGATFEAVATVRNETLTEATGYKVELYSGDKLLSVAEGSALAPNSQTDFAFDVEMPVLAAEPLPLHAAVVFAADEVADNNVADAITVEPLVSRLTAPASLRASYADGSVELSWTEPDIAAGVALPLTEDFESAQSWARSYGDWEFVDRDQSEVGGIMGVTMPTVDYSISKLPFFVFDNTADGMDASFTTTSGNKFLASLFLWNNTQVDDWAVSPRLDGSAQSVFFYARSYSGNYPETIEVYYTTTDEPFHEDNYVMCARFADIPGYFKEYKADLPEGATHFAIRNCATGAYMLILDDVTFVPDSPRTDVSLTGYDIYRNGEKINGEPVEDTTYSDSDANIGESYTYNVVALYDKGTSAPSNQAMVDLTGVSDIISDGDAVIRTDGRAIVVAHAAGKNVAIHGVDGKMMFSGRGEGILRIAVPQGVYMVRAGDKVEKVIVK